MDQQVTELTVLQQIQLRNEMSRNKIEIAEAQGKALRLIERNKSIAKQLKIPQ